MYGTRTYLLESDVHFYIITENKNERKKLEKVMCSVKTQILAYRIQEESNMIHIVRIPIDIRFSGRTNRRPETGSRGTGSIQKVGMANAQIQNTPWTTSIFFGFYLSNFQIKYSN